MPLVQPSAPEAGQPRTAALDSPDPAARRAAIRGMARDAAAASALAARLDVETDRAVLAALFDALAEAGGPDAAAALIRRLRSDDAVLRSGAVGALKRMPAEMAAAVGALLSDADPDMRVMAVDVLQDLPHPDAPRWLADRLGEEPHVNVAGAILDRLTEIGDETALEAIAAARRRFGGEPYIAFACDEAVAAIGGAARCAT
jgi:HEAT repeat protein